MIAGRMRGLPRNQRPHAHRDRALAAMPGDGIVGDLVVDETVGRCTVRAYVPGRIAARPEGMRHRHHAALHVR